MAKKPTRTFTGASCTVVLVKFCRVETVRNWAPNATFLWPQLPFATILIFHCLPSLAPCKAHLFQPTDSKVLCHVHAFFPGLRHELGVVNFHKWEMWLPKSSRWLKLSFVKTSHCLEALKICNEFVNVNLWAKCLCNSRRIDLLSHQGNTPQNVKNVWAKQEGLQKATDPIHLIVKAMVFACHMFYI